MKSDPLETTKSSTPDTADEIVAIRDAIKAQEGKIPPKELKGLAKELFEKMSQNELYEYLERKEIKNPS